MSDATRDSIEMIAGVPLVLVLPSLVELVKQQGLPKRWAGLASIVLAIVLNALGDMALGRPHETGWRVAIALWIIDGIVYGLAAAGLYSQRDVLLPDRRPPAGPPARTAPTRK